ncbi:MAG: helix-turn-helix domain-containing protein [Thermogutta sp.]|nr:helix-turn-helix domain-containing protein [Thermogutta sp.]
MESGKLLIGSREAARMLSISERTLWRLVFETADRPLPHIRVGRRVLFSKTDLEEWIRANRTVGREHDEEGRE